MCSLSHGIKASRAAAAAASPHLRPTRPPAAAAASPCPAFLSAHPTNPASTPHRRAQPRARGRVGARATPVVAGSKPPPRPPAAAVKLQARGHPRPATRAPRPRRPAIRLQPPLLCNARSVPLPTRRTVLRPPSCARWPLSAAAVHHGRSFPIPHLLCRNSRLLSPSPCLLPDTPHRARLCACPCPCPCRCCRAAPHPVALAAPQQAPVEPASPPHRHRPHPPPCRPLPRRPQPSTPASLPAHSPCPTRPSFALSCWHRVFPMSRSTCQLGLPCVTVHCS